MQEEIAKLKAELKEKMKKQAQKHSVSEVGSVLVCFLNGILEEFRGRRGSERREDGSISEAKRNATSSERLGIEACLKVFRLQKREMLWSLKKKVMQQL